MRNLKTFTVGLFIAISLGFVACDKDDDQITNPIEYGTIATVRNSFESAYFSTYPGFEAFVNETPYGDTVSNAVTDAVEFTNYLGLYTIDIQNNSISYKLADIAPEGIMFRTIEPGTYDRYYITFDKAQAFKSLSVDDEFVKVSILSNTEIKVEIGEGYDFTSGHTFTITLE